MPRKQKGEEIRAIRGAEIRAVQDSAGNRSLEGMIPYSSRSVDLGGFVEEILPGAFAGALRAGADVLCLRDHKQELLMGRTTSGTLSLSDSTEGLRWKVQLPKTQQAEDLAESVARGDLDTNSFGFICNPGGDKWAREGGTSVRTLSSVELLEISPCSFAAYPASTAALRSCPPELRTSIHVKSEKRYKRVLSALTGTYWAITESKLQTICDVLSTRAEGGHLSQDEVRAAMMAQSDSTPANVGKVAILPMYGVITHRASMFSDWSGGCSVSGMQARFRAALADDSIDTILFDVDSPGGDVSGVPEFAAEIFAARGQKKMIAVANATAGSAAYFLASQADELYVTPSGSVGSIGVYMVHEDDSKLLDDLGVTMTLIKAGEFKAEGISFQPLTKDAKAAWQANVDTYYQMFVTAVARGRGVSAEVVTDGFGQGRMVLASEAVAQKMADQVGTLDSVLAGLGMTDPRRQMDSANLLTASVPSECTCNCPGCVAGDCDDCSIVGCDLETCDCDGEGTPDDDDLDEWRASTLQGLEIRKRLIPNRT